MILDLLPQTFDMYIHSTGIANVFISPDPVSYTHLLAELTVEVTHRGIRFEAGRTVLKMIKADIFIMPVYRHNNRRRLRQVIPEKEIA